jgi:AraC-like DNA-binding protein
VGLVFDTTSVEHWRAQTAETFFPMSIRPRPGRPFRARLAAHELGAVAIGRVVAEPNVCLRTPRDIAAADPELLRILVLRRGRTHVRQGDRSCTIGDGDVVVYDSTRPFAVDARRRSDLVVCGVPLALLGPHADRMRDLAATRIPHDAPVARMFTRFVEGVADELGGDGLTGAELELGDTLIAFSRALARREDVRAGSRLRAVQAWIDAHLADPSLSPARIAAANFVSVRSLHRLFEAEGVSVSAWMRARRLEGCRRDLADPAQATRTIAEIAWAWGWRDAAGFSRRFRAAYGRSPSDLRAEGQLARAGAEAELDQRRLDR